MLCVFARVKGIFVSCTVVNVELPVWLTLKIRIRQRETAEGRILRPSVSKGEKHNDAVNEAVSKKGKYNNYEGVNSED